MADKKISQLSSASTPLAGTEVLPIVQSSTTVKVSVADLTAGRAVAASTLTVSGDAAVGGAEAISTSAGRVYLAVKGTGTAAGTGNGVLQFQTNAAGSTSPNVGNIEWNLPDNTVSSSTRVSFISSSIDGATAGNRGSYMVFATKTDNVSGSGTERMRIDSNGNLFVGTTGGIGATRLVVSPAGTDAAATFAHGSTNEAVNIYNTGNQNYTAIRFLNNAYATVVGSITCTTSVTAYNTLSDYRLKENVAPLSTGLAIINALKPVSYNWISDKTKGEGFLAHELQNIIPLAVTGEKDAVNDDGSLKPQGVDYSKIVVHLVAAIQEQQALIENLKARVTVLESR
jgi:hypothetical protein